MADAVPIYFDYQATTPVDPAVLGAMLPYFSEDFGNPHASEHYYGRRAATAVAFARQQVADLLNARPSEIIFTSGATEANNLLLKSAAAHMAAQGRPRIVSVASEHKAVLEVLARLARQGFEIMFADLGSDGIVSLASLASLIDDRTGLVSVMAVNNEIGVIQDLTAIGGLCRARGALFHSDAAQACGKLPLDLAQLPVDLMSIAGHKFYGPKGIGAAFIRRGLARLLEAQQDGGGQERGLRGGTLPTALCVGLGEACVVAGQRLIDERAALLALREAFLATLREAGAAFVVNGSLDARWPGNLNLSFAGVDAEALVIAVADRLAISSGSACTADSLEASHVLRALGLDEDRAAGAVRIGFGRSTRLEEVNTAARILADSAAKLASLGWSGTMELNEGYGHAAE